MRPVDKKFPVSQGFGGGATEGVDPYGNDPMAYLVRQYGNYQPYGHAGEDIACPVGTPVYAMAAGTVLWADWGTNLPGDDSDWGYRQRHYLYKAFPGIVTVIQHSWGKGVYAHLSDNDAAPAGTKVKEGQLIGHSGDTGGVAPHLHVEALINDSYVTQGGLIYGRTNPAGFYGTAAIAPQATEEDTLSAAEVKEIKDHINAVLIGGYTWHDGKHYGIAPILEQVQRQVAGTPAAVWAVPVKRAGGNVSALQELADAKSKLLGLEPAIARIEDNTDPAALADLIPDALAQQVIDALAARLNGAK
jgi:murein DD-endopeptidase MepM/ murein hydrolase activator NlpD